MADIMGEAMQAALGHHPNDYVQAPVQHNDIPVRPFWPLFVCSVVGCSYVARHLKQIVEHLTYSHQKVRKLFMECGLDGCRSRLNTPDSFRTHVIRHHRDLWNAPLAPAIRREEIFNIQDFPDDLSDFCDLADDKTADELFTITRSWVKSESLTLRLNMEHLYEVPAATVKGMHAEIKKFITSFQSRLTATILKRLEEIEVKDNALQAFVSADPLLDALHVTKTQAKKRFASMDYVAPKRFQLVEPLIVHELEVDAHNDEAPDEIVLDDFHQEAEVIDLLNPTPAKEKASGVMHYVPILDTLKAYLKHDDVVRSIRRERFSDAYIDRYTSGVFFRSHPVFRENPHALRITLYMDELEVCNPLGGNKGKHKLTVVYFSVGNVEQHFLSSLLSIHLALICEYPNVAKYGYELILKPLIEDLKLLQTQGITVVTNEGEECRWLGSLAYICGDNATQHEIGGFRRCFSSGRVCRFCMAHYDHLHTLLSEEQCTLRTAAAHNYHVQSVLADPKLVPLYGVTGRSPFMELGVGSPVEILCPDVLHDCLEGLMSTHVTNVIRTLHRHKVVSLKETIRLVNGFPYGQVDKLKKHPGIPKTFMRKGVHLIGSASQRWILFYILPLALGDKVPADNEFWSLFLLVTKIMEIVLAPVLDRDWIAMLQELVEEHHELWIRLYPDQATYKWHVLLHYARLLLVFGSLRHLWTMRFENFHQFFKRMARKLLNFQCISKTLSERFQRKRCMEFSGETALPDEIVLEGMQTTCKLSELMQNEKNALLHVFNQMDTSHKLLKVKKIVFRGIKFVRGCYVVLNVSGDGAPVFLKIETPCIVNDQVVLFGRLSFVVGWNSNVHAYTVEVSTEPGDFVCILGEKVCSPQTLDGYVIGGVTHIKMRFLPFCKVD